VWPNLAAFNPITKNMCPDAIYYLAKTAIMQFVRCNSRSDFKEIEEEMLERPKKKYQMRFRKLLQKRLELPRLEIRLIKRWWGFRHPRKATSRKERSCKCWQRRQAARLLAEPIADVGFTWVSPELIINKLVIVDELNTKTNLHHLPTTLKFGASFYILPMQSISVLQFCKQHWNL